MVRLEAVDLRIAIVGENQTLLGVEHGQALRHVRERHVEFGVLHLELGQRHIEAGIAGLQLGLALLQQHVLLCEAVAEPVPLGDVLVDGDPAAVSGRSAVDQDDAPVVQVARLDRGLERGSEARALVFLVLDRGVETLGDAVREHIGDARARLRQALGQTVHLGIAAVAHHDPLLGVDHAQAMRHVGERDLEAVVLPAKLFLPLLQHLVAAPQLLLDAPPLREIADGIDLVGPLAAVPGLAYDLDLDDEARCSLEHALDGLARRSQVPRARSRDRRRPSFPGARPAC